MLSWCFFLCVCVCDFCLEKFLLECESIWFRFVLFFSVSLRIISSIDFGQVSFQSETSSVTMSSMVFRRVGLMVFVLRFGTMMMMSTMSVPVSSASWRCAIWIVFVDDVNRWYNDSGCDWSGWHFNTRNCLFVRGQTIVVWLTFHTTLRRYISGICEIWRCRTMHIDCIHRWRLVSTTYNNLTNNLSNFLFWHLLISNKTPATTKLTNTKQRRKQKKNVIIDTNRMKCPLRWDTYRQSCYCYRAHFEYNSVFEAVDREEQTALPD